MLAAVVFLSLGGLCAIPIYRSAMRWRAVSLAAQALEAAGKPDMEKAFSLVRSAYNLRPMEPRVLRAVAQVCDLRGDASAVQFWQILTTLPSVTPEDRQGYIRCALDRQMWNPKVDEQLQWLLKAQPQSATIWLLMARAMELGGNLVQSQNAARHAVALDGDNEEAALFLGRRLLMPTNTRQEALQLLEPLALKPGKNGLAAALLLARQPQIAPKQLDLLHDRLEKDPLGNVTHRLSALELEIRKSSDRADAILAAAVEHYRKEGGDNLVAFGGWLNSHEVPAMVSQAISREMALKDRKLLLVYLDALAAQQKWREVESVVAAPEVPLEKFLIELFKARCAHELGENEHASDHWRAAQSSTLGNPEQSLYVAKYARQFGRIAQAESIYRSLTVGNSARLAYVELLGLVAGQGTRAMRTVLKEMQARWPMDETIQNDYAYCSLLLGEEIDKSRATALELVQKAPGVVAYRTTVALAWLRSGKPEEALAAYSSLNIDWPGAPASFRAIAAAALWANGQKAEARKMAETCRSEDLKAEEQALVKFSDD